MYVRVCVCECVLCLCHTSYSSSSWSSSSFSSTSCDSSSPFLLHKDVVHQTKYQILKLHLYFHLEVGFCVLSASCKTCLQFGEPALLCAVSSFGDNFILSQLRFSFCGVLRNSTFFSWFVLKFLNRFIEWNNIIGYVWTNTCLRRATLCKGATDVKRQRELI